MVISRGLINFHDLIYLLKFILSSQVLDETLPMKLNSERLFDLFLMAVNVKLLHFLKKMDFSWHLRTALVYDFEY